MKANTEIPVTLLDLERKKKIYTESFVLILIMNCELHNIPSQELHIPRKNSLFHLIWNETELGWYTTMTALFVNKDHVLLPITQF